MENEERDERDEPLIINNVQELHSLLLAELGEEGTDELAQELVDHLLEHDHPPFGSDWSFRLLGFDCWEILHDLSLEKDED